jgi:hypothetical protein
MADEPITGAELDRWAAEFRGATGRAAWALLAAGIRPAALVQ